MKKQRRKGKRGNYPKTPLEKNRDQWEVAGRVFVFIFVFPFYLNEGEGLSPSKVTVKFRGTYNQVFRVTLQSSNNFK